MHSFIKINKDVINIFPYQDIFPEIIQIHDKYFFIKDNNNNENRDDNIWSTLYNLKIY